MEEITYQEALFDTGDAILNQEYEGFKEDYLILHSLIRKHKPETFFEVGTNMGTGTNIICNGMNYIVETDEGEAMVVTPVYSLDLPTELAHKSLQHPISEGKGDKVGSVCRFPFTQLRGDSLKYDFSEYPCEGYFIDGEHDYEHPYNEALSVFELLPNIVIWHDADIKEVGEAITDSVEDVNSIGFEYDLFRVTGTRIAYCLKV